jgi:hypothetical protein
MKKTNIKIDKLQELSNLDLAGTFFSIGGLYWSIQNNEPICFIISIGLTLFLNYFKLKKIESMRSHETKPLKIAFAKFKKNPNLIFTTASWMLFIFICLFTAIIKSF